MTLPTRIAAALATDTSRPLVTWYDDTTGERVELSVATFGNWVAKTANLLRDDLDVQPGDHVVVSLPAHWQTPVVLVAAWLAAATVVALPPGDPVPSAAAAFVAESDLDTTTPSRGTAIVALSLRPMAGRLAAPRPGVLDFAAEVPAHGDAFALGPAPDAPAAVVDGSPLDATEVIARAEASGLTAGQRALVRHEPWTRDGLVAVGLAPLLVGAGVLLRRGVDDVPQALLDAERVTAVLG